MCWPPARSAGPPARHRRRCGQGSKASQVWRTGWRSRGGRAGIEGSTGVERQLEFVRERDGVKWYNDSIASAPERVVAALNSFEEPIVLLAGGRDKKLPWEDFARLATTRVKHLVFFGEAGPLIQRAVEAAGG